MAPRIALALAIHNHQPVGNFGWVFAEVFDQAYAPMVDALGRHPGVRVALHYTGPLLEWLSAERPSFVEDLRALVARGQVELMGGGLYEPILASLPERDRVAQLARMADRIEDFGGRRPHGAWLAERVWEPDLPTALAEAGYDWTILDDAHFRAASIAEENLWGAYTTEDQGRPLRAGGPRRPGPPHPSRGDPPDRGHRRLGAPPGGGGGGGEPGRGQPVLRRGAAGRRGR